MIPFQEWQLPEPSRFEEDSHLPNQRVHVADISQSIFTEPFMGIKSKIVDNEPFSKDGICEPVLDPLSSSYPLRSVVAIPEFLSPSRILQKN